MVFTVEARFNYSQTLVSARDEFPRRVFSPLLSTLSEGEERRSIKWLAGCQLTCSRTSGSAAGCKVSEYGSANISHNRHPERRTPPPPSSPKMNRLEAFSFFASADSLEHLVGLHGTAKGNQGDEDFMVSAG